MNLIKKILLFTLFLVSYRPLFAANQCRLLVHNSQAPAYSPEISVIIGTDNKGSKSALVASEVVTQLIQNPSTKINLIDLKELPNQIFKSGYFNAKPRQFVDNFVAPIERAQGLIFVIPEYDGAVPGILSYYMNHMRSSLSQKQVVLVGLSAGRWGARSPLDAFKGMLSHRGARTLGDLQINIAEIDLKITNNTLTDTETLKRIETVTKELSNSLNQLPSNTKTQQLLVQIGQLKKEQQVEVQLNNTVSIEGQLIDIILNENKTPAFLKFSGPTRLKKSGQIIEGQDINIHSQGYSTPVGSIKGLKAGWHKKDTLASSKITTEGRLTVGKKVKLEYESGVIINGRVKSLTHDQDENLIVITFAKATVTKGDKLLYNPDWGDYDVVIADHITEIN